jgi:hypothetical protein
MVLNTIARTIWNLLIICVSVLQFWSIDPLDVFGPVVEEGAGAFLTANPFYVIQSGKYNHVPWMMGVVTDEGIVRASGVYP